MCCWPPMFGLLILFCMLYIVVYKCLFFPHCVCLSVYVCFFHTRVGLCGVCRPGQCVAPAPVGNLLVSVLSSLLLLLRQLLLLSWHLLLPTPPWVTPSFLKTGVYEYECLNVQFHLTVYEAGKMAKRGQPPQVPVYPYYIPGVPAVVPLAPSSQMEPKITSIPSVENTLGGGKCQCF